MIIESFYQLHDGSSLTPELNIPGGPSPLPALPSSLSEPEPEVHTLLRDLLLV